MFAPPKLVLFFKSPKHVCSILVLFIISVMSATNYNLTFITGRSIIILHLRPGPVRKHRLLLRPSHWMVNDNQQKGRINSLNFPEPRPSAPYCTTSPDQKFGDIKHLSPLHKTNCFLYEGQNDHIHMRRSNISRLPK